MNTKKMVVLMIVTLLLVSLFAVPVYAGDGNGDSALKLENSSVIDGESNVEIDREIILTFSNNVVNLKVKDNNVKCFTLLDSDENVVSIEVKMADDQVERDKRNDIIIAPVEELREGTKYTLVVSSLLTAKNGNKLDEELTISFSTVGEVESNKQSSKILWIGVILLVVIVFVIIKKKK